MTVSPPLLTLVFSSPSSPEVSYHLDTRPFFHLHHHDFLIFLVGGMLSIMWHLQKSFQPKLEPCWLVLLQRLFSRLEQKQLVVR